MYLEIRQPVPSFGRTPGQLFFMAVLYTLFIHSSRENLTKNYRNYYKAVTAKINSFHYSVILLTKPYFNPAKSCILSHFSFFLNFLLQCQNFPVRAALKAEQGKKRIEKAVSRGFSLNGTHHASSRALSNPLSSRPRLPGHCESEFQVIAIK